MSRNRQRTLQRDLKIVAWNANGLLARREELLEFMARHKPDVLLLSETHLTPHRQYRLPNYVLYRDDRPGPVNRPARGGTAVAVKTSIGHHRVDLPPRVHLEATAVELHGALGGIVIVSAYKPPSATLLASDLDVVFQPYRKVILAGDLNCKHPDWGSRLITPNGRRLQEYAHDRHLHVIGPDQPTSFPFRRAAYPDVLDIALVKGVACPVNIFSMSELSSDHCPVLVHVETQHSIYRASRRIIDWDRFGPAFCRRLPEDLPLETTQQVDDAVNMFDTAVISAMEVSSRVKHNLTPDYHRIPEPISNLASEKNRLRRRWQRTRDPADKAAFNRTAGKLRRELQAFRRTCWEYAVSRVADSPEEDASAWRIPTALTGKKRRATIPAISGPLGQLLGRPEEKSEYLSAVMERQFAPNPPSDRHFEEDISDEIEEMLRLPITSRPEPTTVEEVAERLLALRPRKAAGPDGVSNTALQRLPDRGVHFLVDLFNSCLGKAYFPRKWRKATVIMIPKPGKDPKIVGNLRPISLLSATSKVFERIIQRRVRDHLQRLEILIPEQFGFREGHSSTHLLMRLVETIAGAGCSGAHAFAVFLDVEKAFDRVWHDGLLHKLAEVQLPDCYVHLIASFLRCRSFCVRVDNHLSQERPVTAGVPQGSVLGPLLYSVYANDIPREPGVELSIFADDTAAYAVDRTPSFAARRLQRQLDKYAEWAAKWKVSVNPAKSTAVYFSRRRKYPRQLAIGRHHIAWSNTVKYLGLHLDRRLTWRAHASYVAQRLNNRLHQLRPILQSDAMTRRLGKRLVSAYVLPVATYAIPVWGYLAASHKKKIQSLLDRGLRWALKAHWLTPNIAIRTTCGVRPLNVTIRHISRKFYRRAARFQGNHLITGLGQYRTTPGDPWQRPKRTLSLA